MENIQFNQEDRELQNLNNPSAQSPSRMIGWVIKYSGGMVKDETQANYILLGIASIFFILTIITIINGMGIGPKKTVYREDITPEIRAAMPMEIYDSLPTRNTSR
ncbi:MAG: hypothetical protein Q7S11_01690 [bacterium]|nr:hypothetical protein [bacterium]